MAREEAILAKKVFSSPFFFFERVFVAFWILRQGKRG